MAMNKPHTTVASRMTGYDDAWLERAKEDVLEPDLVIVDPHHHFLPEFLTDTASGHKIESTVFLECTASYRAGGPEEWQSLGETEFVNGIAAMSASGGYGPTRVAAGIVGLAELRIGARVEEVLRAHIAACGGPKGRFKGIRYAGAWEDKEAQIHNSHTQPTPHMYRDDPKFREGFAVLGKLGLTFDAWIYHNQIPDLTALARAFPAQKIVLDHVGGPLGLGFYSDKRDAVFADWKKNMLELATCPNVYIKLGGMGMRVNGFEFQTKPVPPSSQELAAAWKPYVETCILAFGAKRCMFESNFPVDKLSGSYRTYWNAFKRLATGASATDKALLFRDTAKAFYSLS
jgi:L-fuconolactonase